MPFQLDDYDVRILKALLRDGRKSFREISRETVITTPAVKARFNRLVNVGFIKSVSLILDFNIVEESIGKSELQKNRNGGQGDSETINIRGEEGETRNNNKKQEKHYNSSENNKNHQSSRLQLQTAKSRIKKGMKIKLDCEFCQGPILGNPYIFKFANYERFFCCTGCMSGYKKKYAGR